MALLINTLRGTVDGGLYVSDVRLGLTVEGDVVSAEDTRSVRLLVGVGGSLPIAEAERYGLLDTPADEPSLAESIVSAVDEIVTAPDEAVPSPEPASTPQLEQPEAAAPVLSDLTVVELKDRAEAAGVAGFKRMNKGELIAAIEAHSDETRTAEAASE